jgi:hypothetical protein
MPYLGFVPGRFLFIGPLIAYLAPQKPRHPLGFFLIKVS